MRGFLDCGFIEDFMNVRGNAILSVHVSHCKREGCHDRRLPAILHFAPLRSDNSNMALEFTTSYLKDSIEVLQYYKKLGERAMAQVSDEALLATPDPESNSIAIIVRHLAGNMRSRFTDFLTSDGEKPDRNRDGEFEVPPSASRADLMKAWEEGWKTVFDAIDALAAADVLRPVTIRGEPHSVLQALGRQQAHYAQHVGQIVYVAKLLRGGEWRSLSIPRGKSEEFNRRA